MKIASHFFFSAYLMRFVVAANLLGFPAISVPVSNVFIVVHLDLSCFHSCNNHFIFTTKLT